MNASTEEQVNIIKRGHCRAAIWPRRTNPLNSPTQACTITFEPINEPVRLRSKLPPYQLMKPRDRNSPVIMNSLSKSAQVQFIHKTGSGQEFGAGRETRQNYREATRPSPTAESRPTDVQIVTPKQRRAKSNPKQKKNKNSSDETKSWRKRA